MMTETSSSENISTRLLQIAKLAREAPEMVFTTLAHHIDAELLLEAYGRTRKDGAPGVDKQTAADYAKDLEGNLRSLLSRFKSGAYKAPPVRRALIPKGDGKSTRPIGVPTFEDKVLQRGVTMVLEAVYEQDFLNCSYGFRPRRSPHQALEVLRNGLMDMKGGWVLEVDIKDFFGTLRYNYLRAFLDQRVRDGVIRRTIDKWLKAGVLENGRVTHPDAGTPQGGVASPLLANIYLHEVMDKWFHEMVIPRLRGHAFMVRYADDIVCAFSNEDDARRVMEVLPKRFGKYGLTLHPEKTKLVEFRRPKRKQGGNPGKRSGPGIFDFLGFTHYWGLSRNGNWVVKQKTAKDRLRRAIKGIYEWCRTNLHVDVAGQHAILKLKVTGHYRYYGITGNSRSLSCFYQQVQRAWQKWLNRRSQRRRMDWERFKLLLERYPLPPPTVVHSIMTRSKPMI
jgi:group II intron reverse transcriptase/maturase